MKALESDTDIHQQRDKKILMVFKALMPAVPK